MSSQYTLGASQVAVFSSPIFRCENFTLDFASVIY